MHGPPGELNVVRHTSSTSDSCQGGISRFLRHKATLSSSSTPPVLKATARNSPSGCRTSGAGVSPPVSMRCHILMTLRRSLQGPSGWTSRGVAVIPRGECFTQRRSYGLNQTQIDPERTAALGSSFGGYMINWINGHNDQFRFKALVCHDGVFNTAMTFYTTEVGHSWSLSKGLADDTFRKSGTSYSTLYRYSALIS